MRLTGQRQQAKTVTATRWARLCHRREVRNVRPPMPDAAASCAPNAEGLSAGTNSANRVGRLARSKARSRKSRRMACTGLVRRRRDVVSQRLLSTFWRTLNIPLPPGTASTIDLSSPKRVCHFLTEVRPWLGGTLSRISNRRLTRWGGARWSFSTCPRANPRSPFEWPKSHLPSASS